MSAPDKVLSTLLLRYPRFIHAEMMTHRVFSRNGASGRAIPTQKLIDDVRNDPVIPLHWGKNEKGMQANGELENMNATIAWQNWDRAMGAAIECACAMRDTGLHKQIVNRILEPFAHITVLVSSTEWDNFLELRDHDDAEPHIRMLAKEVCKCLEADDVQDLEAGMWHLPFTEGVRISTSLEDSIKLSVARCASTSYKTVDGFDMTLDRAIALHDKLVSSRPIHASPCEHVAMADDVARIRLPDGWHDAGFVNPHQHGNFIGFRQYRHMI